jgi:hypothetical protein
VAAFALLGAFFLSGRMALLPAVLVMWSLGLTAAGFGDLVLEDRGRQVTCTVRDKDTRYETSTTTDANGLTSTTTTRYFDLALSCPDGGPRKVTTTSDVGRKGRPLDVAYDPAGRIPPQPVSDTDHQELRLSAGLVGAAVVIGVVRQMRARRRYAGRPW